MSLAEEQIEITGELARELAANDGGPSMLDVAPGLHEAIPESVYHARAPGMASKSGLDQLRRSPAHYRAWVDGRIDRDSTALRFGKAVHCAILEPARFATEYVIAPDFGDCRRRENKLARDAWNKGHADSVVLRNSEGLAMLGMIRAVVAHPLVASLFEGGVAEATLRWDDKATGVPCKGRVDLYRQDLATALDVKSTTDASKASFARDLWSYGYYRQDAFYRSGFRATCAPIEHFLFVCVEKTLPHAVALYTIDAAALERGYVDNEALLEKLAQCVRANDWSGYPESIQTVSLPRWAEERAS